MGNVLQTRPAAAGAVFAALFAVAQAVQASLAGGQWDTTTYIGLAGALFSALYAAGWIHRKVTPLADPKMVVGGAVVPLVPGAAAAAADITITPPPETATGSVPGIRPPGRGGRGRR